VPLKVAGGSAVLRAGTDSEKTYDSSDLLMQEISQPQTVRYFFDYPKPNKIAAREMYEVQWEEGHVYGNVDELDPTNGMVMRLLQYQKLPTVFVWCVPLPSPRLAPACWLLVFAMLSHCSARSRF
jgi:hypothetical protein